MRGDDGTLQTPWADFVLNRLRSRVSTHEARDMLETIAHAQREAVFLPWHTPLVIEGGPGTGKTEVGILRLVRALGDPEATTKYRSVLWLVPSQTFESYFTPMIAREFGATAFHTMTPSQWLQQQAGLKLSDLHTQAAPMRHTQEWMQWIAEAITAWRNAEASRLVQKLPRKREAKEKDTQRRWQLEIPDDILIQAIQDAAHESPAQWKQRVFDALNRRIQAVIQQEPITTKHSAASEQKVRRTTAVSTIISRLASEWTVQWNAQALYEGQLQLWDPHAVLTPDDLPALVWLTAQGPSSVKPKIPADVVIIDEGELITPALAVALRAYYNAAAWTVIGDRDQLSDVRPANSSWATLFDDTTPPTIVTLETNYRSTPAIIRLLNALRSRWRADASPWKALDWDDTPVTGWLHSDQSSQVQAVVEWARNHHIANETALLVAPNSALAQTWADQLAQVAVPITDLTHGDPWQPHTIGISVPGHIHGLECDHVWIVDADSVNYPKSSASTGSQTAILTNTPEYLPARRLYMAASRAMRTLTVSAVKETSEWLHLSDSGIAWTLYWPQLEGWTCLPEAASKIGIAESILAKWVSSKAWPSQRRGAWVFVPTSMVDAYSTTTMATKQPSESESMIGETDGV
ncbi:MAG: hypothetical protein M1318_01305 [Firmicutes bacterium]|nr:hypothetical protein [Bacillota bacterium]